MKKIYLLLAFFMIISGLLIAGCGGDSSIKATSTVTPTPTTTTVPSGVTTLLNNISTAWVNGDSAAFAEFVVIPVTEVWIEDGDTDTNTFQDTATYVADYADMFSLMDFTAYNISNVNYTATSDTTGTVTFSVAAAFEDPDTNETANGSLTCELIVVQDSDNWKYNYYKTTVNSYTINSAIVKGLIHKQ